MRPKPIFRLSLFTALIAALLMPLPLALAQSAGSCSGLPFRQDLDFWVGDWNIYSDQDDFLGRQTVTEWENGCMLEAVWTGVAGDTAQSLNTYDPNLGMWRQLHISPTEIADLRGTLSNGTMRMDGDLFRQSTRTFLQRRVSLSIRNDGDLLIVTEERSANTDPWIETGRMTGVPAAGDPQSPNAPTPSGYQPGQATCWNYDERDDFSFSAGDWSVGTASNRLSTHQSGCLIRERWFASAADTGISYNFFDPFAGAWRQVWVSPSLFIDITGGAVSPGGAMQLTGTIHYTQTGQVQPYRGTWTPTGDNSMTQLLEQRTNDVWSNWFSGTYVRRSTTAEARVGFSGLGAGEVNSLPTGIACNSGTGQCARDFRLDQPVTFTAEADAGSAFAGWSDGPCFGQTGECHWNVAQARELVARFTLDTVPDGRIVAALLPGARSGYVGGPDLTVLASVVSRASTPAQSCRISVAEGSPATLRYRRVDSANMATGPENPVFDLDAGGSAAFVLALTPVTATPSAGVEFAPEISCQNAVLTSISGVNTLALSIDTAPVPDILSISATPSADGVIRIGESGGVGFMTAAAINIGAGDGSAGSDEATITVTADDGGTGLPLTLQVCETAPTGGCLAPRTSAVTSVFGSGAKFFAVFARAGAGSPIAFDPAGGRVYLRFTDANGVVRSVTSAAVTAPD